MRKFTITFKPTDNGEREPLTVEADDVNMGAAGQIPCLIFFAVSTIAVAGQQGPSGKIVHIVPLEAVLHCTSEEPGRLALGQ